MGQTNQRLFTATEIEWRVLREKNAPVLFLNLQKRSLTYRGRGRQFDVFPIFQQVFAVSFCLVFKEKNDIHPRCFWVLVKVPMAQTHKTPQWNRERDHSFF
jgi:hypothetical protein